MSLSTDVRRWFVQAIARRIPAEEILDAIEALQTSTASLLVDVASLLVDVASLLAATVQPPTEWFNRPVQKDVAAQRRAA